MQENPTRGLCECGCGEAAPIAKVNNTKRGWIKGQPLRFVRGHSLRGERQPHSAETRAKLSAAATKRNADPALRERLSAERRGIPRSPETIEKVRQALTGRKLSAEHRARLSEIRQGRTVTLAMSAAYARVTAEGHTMWKGMEANSATKHAWLNKHFRKTGICAGCGEDVGTSKGGTEWAFLHHPDPHTRNRSDYRELCVRCHRHMDYEDRIEREVQARVEERLRCLSESESPM